MVMMKYETPSVELLMLSVVDILTASGDGFGDGSDLELPL